MRKPDGTPPESLFSNEANHLSTSEPVCPVGELDCQYLVEVNDLREKVTDLSHLLNTDSLTGLYNHRYFEKALEAEMERTVRTGQSTSLLMVDLDHFKSVNDTYGHEVGNKALVQAATIMKNMVRKLDIPCRYGGEEFALILPSTDLLTAIKVAERVRSRLEETPVVLEDKELQITASLGVDVHVPGQNDSVQALIQRADQHLYRAKKEGRNRVCHGVLEQAPEVSVSTEEKDMLFALISGDESGLE